MTLQTATPRATRLDLHPRRRALATAMGLALLICAVGVALFPAPAILLVGVAGGWSVWLAGATMLGLAFFLFEGRLRGLAMMVAGAGVILGFSLMLQPFVGAVATTLLVLALLIVDSSFQLVAALRLRPLKAWRWLLASAFASTVAAALLGFSWGAAQLSTQGLAALLATGLATSGIAFLALSLVQRDGVSTVGPSSLGSERSSTPDVEQLS